ncbi:MAG: leucyl aminopeptidase family protein [Dermatophilaceae bacterium]
MPRPDVLLDPPLSTWTVSPDDAAGPAAAGTEVLVIAVGDGPHGDDAARHALDAAALGARLLDVHESSPDAGSVTEVPLPADRPVRRAVVVGTGSGDAGGWRAAGAAAGRATRGRDTVVHALGDHVVGDALAAYVEGVVLGSWVPPRFAAAGPVTPTAPAAHCEVRGGGADGARVVIRAVARARAQLLARALSATPSNVKNPGWFARQAQTVARRSGLSATVWDERALRRDGFGGLLAVGGGSATPPRLVRLDHEPAGATARTPRIVLVGKGITFDTGGLQVKSVEHMVGMKTDMSGAAVVLAVLAACRDLEIPVRVTGLLALAENAVSGSAYRPGDVIRQWGGRTVEIGNTDAEGRIVLADALAYADAELDPRAVVDIATLTGAARIALGRVAAPVFATDDTLAAELVAAGDTTGETLWRMPLPAAYRRALDSQVADLAHHAPGVGGGAITAALFLREFTGSRRWAHLDIAGAGRADADAGLHAEGATGFGTRLLLRWLEETR